MFFMRLQADPMTLSTSSPTGAHHHPHFPPSLNPPTHQIKRGHEYKLLLVNVLSLMKTYDKVKGKP